MTDAERTQLVESHRGHAARVAGKIKRRLPRCVAYDDLEAAALVGLWGAAQAYRPGPGAFRTFARPFMYHAVVDWLREFDPNRRRRKYKLRMVPLSVIRRAQNFANGIVGDDAEFYPVWQEADPRPPGSEQVDAEDAVAVALRALSPRDARIVP